MGRYKWDYALRRRDLDRGCRIPIVLYVIPMKWKEGYIYINCFKMKLKSEDLTKKFTSIDWFDGIVEDYQSWLHI